MQRVYSSFVLRCWVLDDEVRVEVQHMQSGKRTRESSLPAALTWLDRCAGTVSAKDEAARPLQQSGNAHARR
jgi:hypothetical protein